MSIRPILRDPAMTDAFEVAEYMLEVTRKAYTERDFEVFAHRFALPQTVGTFDGDIEITHIDELKNLFDRAIHYFETNDIIDLQRKTIAAQFSASDVVETTYTSRHLYRTYVFSDEIVGHGTIQNFDGVWKITSGRYASANADYIKTLQNRRPRKPDD